MEQVNRILKESGIYDESLTVKEFAYNARFAAGRMREAAESFGSGTQPFRWAIMVASSLEGYGDALDKADEHGDGRRVSG